MNWFVRTLKSGGGNEFFVLILRWARVIQNGYRPEGVIISSKNDRKNWLTLFTKTPWQQMLTAQFNYKGEIYYR